jgi:hypothetical protein
MANGLSLSVKTNVANAVVTCVDKYNYASVIPCSDQNAIVAPSSGNGTGGGNMTAGITAAGGNKPAGITAAGGNMTTRITAAGGNMTNATYPKAGVNRRIT